MSRLTWKVSMTPRSKQDPYFFDTQRSHSVVGAVALATSILLVGLLLLAFLVAFISPLFPSFVLSSTGRPTITTVSVIAECTVAAYAARVATRRLLVGRHLAGPPLFLLAGAGPIGLTVVLDAFALAATATPWWRPMLDVAVVAACTAVGTWSRHLARNKRSHFSPSRY
jgi:hypothetical protein